VRLVAGVRERLVLRCALTVGPMAIGLRQRGAAGSTTVRSGFMTATDRVAASAGQRDAPASELVTPDRKPDTRSSIRGTSGNRQAHAAATTRPQKEGKEISDQIVDRTVPLFIKPISRPGNHRLLTMAVRCRETKPLADRHDALRAKSLVATCSGGIARSRIPDLTGAKSGRRPTTWSRFSCGRQCTMIFLKLTESSPSSKLIRKMIESSTLEAPDKLP
jgi:hypothetical protein